MMTMESLIRSGRGYLQTLPKSKLYMYLFLFVAVVGVSIIGLSLIGKETYHTLFTGLAPEDASGIVAKLKEQKIPYKLEMGGSSISVPKDKVYDVRLSLASQNLLPGSAGVGFELFDKTSYGMTEFMQNVNYKRALQGELSRTINQMPEVKSSRIHIAIPEKTLFLDREKDVTASVLLKLKPGRSLGKEQTLGIVHLVSGSIEGLKHENISVIESSGRVLYKGGEKQSAVAMSGQQFELQKNIERKLEESIQSMLDRFIPASKSIIRANVELNMRKVETIEEEYSPDKKVVTSEKKLKEKAVNKTTRPGGVPGVATNVPGVAGNRTAVADSSGRATESEREESQSSYETSKTVKKIIEPYGDLKRVSVAVVVDGKYEKIKGQKGEELKYIPRTQNELNDIKNLISRAVGYNEQRGDKVEVLNIPFETDQFSDEKLLIEKEERKNLIMTVLQYVFYVAIVFAVFFFILRPVLAALKSRRGYAPAGVAAQQQDIFVKNGQDAAAKAQMEIAPPPVPNKTQTALAATMGDKNLVASIIREWVREGTG